MLPAGSSYLQFLMARLRTCYAFLRGLVSYLPHQSAVPWHPKCFKFRTHLIGMLGDLVRLQFTRVCVGGSQDKNPDNRERSAEKFKEVPTLCD